MITAKYSYNTRIYGNNERREESNALFRDEGSQRRRQNAHRLLWKGIGTRIYNAPSTCVKGNGDLWGGGDHRCQNPSPWADFRRLAKIKGVIVWDWILLFIGIEEEAVANDLAEWLSAADLAWFLRNERVYVTRERNAREVIARFIVWGRSLVIGFVYAL